MRRLIEVARAVVTGRERFAEAVGRHTGLSAQGVELGFESLECDAGEADVRSLVARAGHATQVHVILSANVFVAPLRALAIARAAAERVTVRPSRGIP